MNDSQIKHKEYSSAIEEIEGDEEKENSRAKSVETNSARVHKRFEKIEFHNEY